MRLGTPPDTSVVHPARNILLKGLLNPAEKQAQLRSAFATFFDGQITYPSPARYGTYVNNGVTDDKAVVDLVFSNNNGVAYIPKGVVKYGTDDSGGSLSGKRAFGQGVLLTGVNKRARSVSHLAAQPSVLGATGSVTTAFNGDFSKSLDVREFRVAGSTTLGNPSAGYTQLPECAAIFSYGYVAASAGKNQATNWTDGRTGWSFQQFKIDQYGQGDVQALTIGIDVWNNKAGATHFLAQPAGTLINGGVTAWVNNVNIVAGEFYIKGQSYDVNGTGFAIHLERNNATGAQEAFWRGVSILSSGTQPIDAAFTARGKIRRGISFELSDLGVGQAAVSMAGEQALVFNSTTQATISANPLASGFRVYSTIGDAKLFYTVLGALNTFVMSKQLTVDGFVMSRGAAGTDRGLIMRNSNNNYRWRVLANGGAESGGNTGSDFVIVRHDDSGASLGTVLYVQRENGNMRLGVIGAQMGFFGGTMVSKPTGVAVTASAIHAALVSLGLIAA